MSNVQQTEPSVRAFPIVLSAPSGAGKTTVANEIFSRFPAIRFSVSLTTRPRRPQEIEGDDYHFVDEETFLKARDGGELAEWAVVHDHLYGTPRAEIESALTDGNHILLDVDVQGGEALIDAYPSAVSIFLLPPSFEIMEQRLRARGTDTEESIARRLAVAIKEIASVRRYQYVIVNRNLDHTVDVLCGIIRSEEHRRTRVESLDQWITERFPEGAPVVIEQGEDA